MSSEDKMLGVAYYDATYQTLEELPKTFTKLLDTIQIESNLTIDVNDKEVYFNYDTQQLQNIKDLGIDINWLCNKILQAK